MKHDRPFSDSVKVGFEIEFISQQDDEEIIKIIEKDMGVELDSYLFVLPFSDLSLDYSKWNIIHDSTVYEDRRGTINPGLEVVTPALPYEEALERLGEFLDVMRYYMKTNDNCSLHVNVSYPGVRSVDTVQIACAIHQLGLTEKYGRVHNEHSQSQFKNIIECIKDNRFFASGIKEALGMRPMLIRQDKHYDVNFLKLYEPDPWLEFRMIGGTGYHRSVDLIDDIKSIVDVCERVDAGEDFTGMINESLAGHQWKNASTSRAPKILEFFEREELNFW